LSPDRGLLGSLPVQVVLDAAFASGERCSKDGVTADAGTEAAWAVIAITANKGLLFPSGVER